ncbi:hypothetical protein [Streptomyces sp. TLI_235]|uniref:hypothetical protein n=1 Tax=Kitasatospora sp. NPDC085879 TaxID=3154769 RepID=UPI000BCF8C0D|nr:hypothetical protein [Streptomyces sp. TLI_235]PBC76547.1 hypothetical protein BX265_1265 [Streptomyces sp. TLI_235]
MRNNPGESIHEAAPGPAAHPDGRTRTAGPARAAGRLAAAVLAVLALLFAAACSSSSSSGSSSPSPSAPASTASASASGGGTAPADAEAAKTAIKTNWEKFFDPATPIADKAALLQNGEALAPALQGFANDPRVGQVKATVTDVQFTSDSAATVTYTLTLQGQTVEPAASGQAVLDNGTWKVSTSTLCGLVTQAGGTTIPGCS